MSEEHLTDPQKILEFWAAMSYELKKHKSEKIGLKNWKYNRVFDLVNHELEERQHKIKNLTTDKREIQKQCVHMANYLLFLYQKCEEEYTDV